jgi:transcriptional regulator with XRE-family HTH domain
MKLRGSGAMTVDWVKFGCDLKQARESANLTLRQAGKLSGIHYATWSRTERGKYVTTEYYLHLCRWMGVDPFRYFTP